MPSRHRGRKEGYIYDHGEGFEIDVSYRQDDGRLSKFVVGLFFKARRSRTMIARFDNEHGFIHLDLLDARGRA